VGFVLCPLPHAKRWILNIRADYRVLADDDRLRELHLDLDRVLLEQAVNWKSHDYGEDYFYQGLDDVGITGLRDTSARLAALNMSELVSGRTVLDIGSNSGFVSIALARTAESVEGIESNPFLNRIGTITASYLGLSNVTFNDGRFEDFQTDATYGVVASFANHSTFDGNTRHTVEEYLEKCHSLLDSDGLFLFESHAPAYEGSRLDNVLETIQERFSIVEKTILVSGQRFDDVRALLVATPKQFASSSPKTPRAEEIL
jgi:cyclopropane fatty-acyl-phospholipid synthase-like methyltransferase